MMSTSSDHEDIVAMRNVRRWKKNIDGSFLACYKYDKVTSTIEKIEIEFTDVMKCSACEEGATQLEFKNLKTNNVCSFVTKMQSKFIRFLKKVFVTLSQRFSISYLINGRILEAAKNHSTQGVLQRAF